MGFDARYELTSPSGARVNPVWREAEGAPLAVVHISHGLGEEAGAYAGFADLLAAGGFHVCAHDHRGHGATRAPDALPGHFGSGNAAEKVLADMRVVLGFVAERNPSLPTILFGRGAGGLIALNHLARHPRKVACLIFEDPPGRHGPWKRALLAWERFRLGSDVASRVMDPTDTQARARPSVGTRRAVAAMQDGLAGRQHPRSVPCDVPVLIWGRTPQRRNIESVAGQLRRAGFSDVTVRRGFEARSDERDATAFRDWAQTILG